jgi:hypothetical protein
MYVNRKMIHGEIVPEMKGNKGEQGGCESKYYIFGIL